MFFFFFLRPFPGVIRSYDLHTYNNVRACVRAFYLKELVLIRRLLRGRGVNSGIPMTTGHGLNVKVEAVLASVNPFDANAIQLLPLLFVYTSLFDGFCSRRGLYGLTCDFTANAHFRNNTTSRRRRCTIGEIVGTIFFFFFH